MHYYAQNRVHTKCSHRLPYGPECPPSLNAPPRTPTPWQMHRHLVHVGVVPPARAAVRRLQLQRSSRLQTRVFSFQFLGAEVGQFSVFEFRRRTSQFVVFRGDGVSMAAAAACCARLVREFSFDRTGRHFNIFTPGFRQTPAHGLRGTGGTRLYAQK